MLTFFSYTSPCVRLPCCYFHDLTGARPYRTTPGRFIDSEANLDSEISSLVVLTAAPETLYREALKYQLPTTLCGLLSHENEDIVTSVVKVIEELTDEDVLDGLEEEEDTEDKGNEGVAEQDRSLSPRRAAERDMVELVRQLVRCFFPSWMYLASPNPVGFPIWEAFNVQLYLCTRRSFSPASKN